MNKVDLEKRQREIEKQLFQMGHFSVNPDLSVMRKLKKERMEIIEKLKKLVSENTLNEEDNMEDNETTAGDLKLTNILRTIKQTDQQLSNEQKRSFVEAIESYNEIAPHIYRDADTMKAISKSLLMISRITETLVTEKTDDWLDATTVKKDMKVINDSAKAFEKTAQEMMGLQHRLESIYEDMGLKISKYFSIKDLDKKPKGSEEEKIEVAPEKKEIKPKQVSPHSTQEEI